MNDANPHQPAKPRGRGWARTGFWTGVIASVAANVAHAFLDGQPSYLMLLFAALPPFALLVGIEVIAQVQWRRVWYQAVIRWGAVGSVAAIGGVVSYDHMREALQAHGETGIGSVLLPLLVDGLMTVCSAALLTIGDNVRRAERVAPLDAAIADYAQARTERLADMAIEPASVQTDVMTPSTAKRPVKKAPAAAKVAKVRASNPALPQEEVAKKAGVSVRTVARHWQDTAPAVNGTSVLELVTTS